MLQQSCRLLQHWLIFCSCKHTFS